jgi:hypothetical protein
MKQFLAALCLILVGTLTVSVISPSIHSFVFHGDKGCPHSKTGKACSSHQENSSEDEPDAGSCVVVVFGKSVEHGFTNFDAFPVELLSVGLTHLESASKLAVGEDFKSQARAPPEKV